MIHFKVYSEIVEIKLVYNILYFSAVWDNYLNVIEKNNNNRKREIWFNIVMMISYQKGKNIFKLVENIQNIKVVFIESYEYFLRYNDGSRSRKKIHNMQLL